MISNHSASASTVIPVLAYADVAEAADWLCPALRFQERLRIGNHRAQLVFGDGAVIVTRLDPPPPTPATAGTDSVHVRVESADSHHAQASGSGAHILSATDRLSVR